MKLTTAAALAVAGLALTGCGTGAQQGAPAEPATTTTTPAGPAATAEPSPPADPTTPAEPSVARVGQWWTYRNGLKVQVARLARSGQGVVATVTIRNNTDQTVDLALANVDLASGPAGDMAEPTYNMDYGLGLSGSLPVGRSKTARYEFAVPRAQQNQIAVEVTPTWDYDAAHFEGAAR